MQRLPTSASGFLVQDAWHEAVIDSSDQPPASMTGLGGAALLQPRLQLVAPQMDIRMSAARSFEMTASTLSSDTTTYKSNAIYTNEILFASC